MEEKMGDYIENTECEKCGKSPEEAKKAMEAEEAGDIAYHDGLLDGRAQAFEEVSRMLRREGTERCELHAKWVDKLASDTVEGLMSCIRCGNSIRVCTQCMEQEGSSILCDYCVHMTTKDD
jgi:hypothetical protein